MRQAYNQDMIMPNNSSCMPNGGGGVAPAVSNRTGMQSNTETVRTRRRSRGGQRGKGISRGRRYRRMGDGSPASRQSDPTAGWKKELGTVHTVLSENTFLDSYITQRVRRFVTSAIQRLKVDLDVNNLTCSRADVMVLLIDEVIQACSKWLN